LPFSSECFEKIILRSTPFNKLKNKTENKPIVYSCSGCSSAAQMTNYLALQLDRKSVAEMSCIVGVGGNVKKLLHTAKSGRPIIVIDGCPLACSKACLINQAIQPNIHFDLSKFGVAKNYHADFDMDEANKILQTLEDCISSGEKKLLQEATIQPQLQNQYKDIEIIEVSTKKQLNAFIHFPLELYKGNKYYVPQLYKDIKATFDKNQNPALEFCEAKYWLAYKDGKLAGRLAGIINHKFIAQWQQPYARFGWFDFIEDENTAFALLQAAEQWARAKGMKAVHGPLGFTNFDYAGMLTAGFEELGTFATIYNFPYYPETLQKAGYKKETGWVEYKISLGTQVSEKLEKVAAIVERRLHLTSLKPTTKKEIQPFANNIFKLLNEAYAGLFGMVALNERQIEYNIKKYLSFIKPEFVSLVLDANKELAGFAITMPSLSIALQKSKGKLFPLGFFHIMKAFKKNNTADLLLVAVRKDLQGKGVNAMLMRDINLSFIKNGIAFAESNPELEENHKVQSMWEYFDARQHKQRACFIKTL